MTSPISARNQHEGATIFIAFLGLKALDLTTSRRDAHD